jgi:hypothetical protein
MNTDNRIHFVPPVSAIRPTLQVVTEVFKMEQVTK